MMKGIAGIYIAGITMSTRARSRKEVGRKPSPEKTDYAVFLICCN